MSCTTRRDSPQDPQISTFTGMKPIISASIITLSLLLIIIFKFTPVFETNDDVGMTMMSAGFGISSQPSTHLIFSHILLGKLLYILPEIAGIVPYSLHIYFGILLASLVTNFAILRLETGYRALALLALLNMLIFLPIMVRPQFTIVAALLSSTSVLLVISLYLLRPVNNKKLFIGVCLAILIGLYGLLTRKEAFIQIIIISAPISLFIFPRNLSTIVKKHIPIALTILLIIIVLHYLNQLSYRDNAAWQSYYEINSLRARFTDFKLVTYSPDNKHLFDTVGWKENDFEMIRNWFYQHEIFNHNNLSFIVNHFPIKNHIMSNFQNIALIPKLCFQNKNLFYMLLVLTILSIVLSSHSRRCIGMSFIVLVTLLVLIHLFGSEFKYRVYFGGVAFMVFFALLLYAFELSNTRYSLNPPLHQWFYPIIHLILVSLVVLQTNSLLLENERNVEKIHLVRNDVKLLQPSPEQLFVIWGGDFPYQYGFPPFDMDTTLRKQKMFGIGASSHAPFAKARLAEFKIDDLCRSFYQHDNVFIIARESYMSLLVSFIWNHYSVRTKPVKYFVGETFSVYHLRTI
jgi:hypothetical protein